MSYITTTRIILALGALIPATAHVSAGVITNVSVSASAPSVNVIVIQDGPFTSRSSWALSSGTDSNAELGQTFSLAADTSLAAVAVQTSDLFSMDTNEGPVRNANGSAFSLVIDLMDAAASPADVTPDSQVAVFTGLLPDDIDNTGPNEWITFVLDNPLNLSAGVQYGFRLVWGEEADGRLISVKHTGSTGTTNPYADGLAYRYSESVASYVAIGTMGHSRDLNFALIGVPEPATFVLGAAGLLFAMMRRTTARDQ